MAAHSLDAAETAAGWGGSGPRDWDPAPSSETEEHFVPSPPPPLRSPAWPVLVGWAGLGVAAVVVLLATFGLPLPRWVGWLAGIGFVGGFILLVLRLPRHRPPDAGDGALL